MLCIIWYINRLSLPPFQHVFQAVKILCILYLLLTVFYLSMIYRLKMYYMSTDWMVTQATQHFGAPDPDDRI